MHLPLGVKYYRMGKGSDEGGRRPQCRLDVHGRSHAVQTRTRGAAVQCVAMIESGASLVIAAVTDSVPNQSRQQLLVAQPSRTLATVTLSSVP